MRESNNAHATAGKIFRAAAAAGHVESPQQHQRASVRGPQEAARALSYLF